MAIEQREDGTYEAFHVCPNCDKAMDALSGIDGAEDPDPGSLAICYYCSFPSVIEQTTDLTLVLREPTRAEWGEILSDKNLLGTFAILAASRN